MKSPTVKRWLALFFCAVFISISAFSSLFLIHEVPHVCTHQHCTFCRAEHVAKRFLTLTATAGAGGFLVAFLFGLCRIQGIPLAAACSTSTLILQKTRMNN